MNDVATLSQLELYSTPHSTCNVVTTPVGTSQEVWGSVSCDNNGSSISNKCTSSSPTHLPSILGCASSVPCWVVSAFLGVTFLTSAVAGVLAIHM